MKIEHVIEFEGQMIAGELRSSEKNIISFSRIRWVYSRELKLSIQEVFQLKHRIQERLHDSDDLQLEINATKYETIENENKQILLDELQEVVDLMVNTK